MDPDRNRSKLGRIGAAAIGAIVGVVALVVALVARPESREPDIVFVVLDTVRASSTSLCGASQPTTPTLEALAGDGWVVSCRGITPGTWTIPSHASFFTGREVIDLAAAGGAVDPDQTLAGQLQARGYQTVMVSANMVLKSPEYLVAGFDTVRRARNFSELRGEALAPAVAEALEPLDPRRPAFLFVNVIDAHAPYPAIPEGVGWVGPQGPVQHRMFEGDPDNPFDLYVSGRMPPPRQARYRGRLERGYAWAVNRSDATLATVLEAVDQAGRLRGARAVITSDHGEFVGEHGQVGHGDTLYDPGIRVPLLVRPAPGDPPPVLPDPVPLRGVFQLLRDGVLPDLPRPITAVHARPSPRDSWSGVATWTDPHTKLVWRQDGEVLRYDLQADPDEQHPQPAADDPAAPGLRSLGAAHLEASAVEGDDPDTIELLRAAGYVE